MDGSTKGGTGNEAKTYGRCVRGRFLQEIQPGQVLRTHTQQTISWTPILDLKNLSRSDVSSGYSGTNSNWFKFAFALLKAAVFYNIKRQGTCPTSSC